MKPPAIRFCFALAAMVVLTLGGCRAIGRFGESRQSIAARSLSGKGFQAIHEGRWELAESLFTDALEVSKSDDRAHWGLAEAYWKRGEKELAVQQMEQAVRLSAGDPKFVERLGRMYLDVGRAADADANSLLALQSKRDSPEAWRLRGDCLHAAGKNEEALAAYHRALALQPDYSEVQIKAAEIYLTDKRYDRLLATLDRLQDGVGIEAAPAKVDMLQGIAMRQLGRSDEALRCFVRASAKNPDDAAPHLEIAALALEGGEIEVARDSLASATRLGTMSYDQGQRILQLQDVQQRMASEPRPSSTPGVQLR
ncbi:tetratricopeptide repeat protein [Rubripirellula reticaptiva]|uniref:Tetratricopeptide repeat protein n=1 Tax=Rubripirellula reticaptiva TaxID=2528013 RepID=A0A5C6FAH4_9BACT|nr:tetratricopeptide repeat protein [Rubripirellula reticaptiva]TWU57414.1 tetratricopeptide repeat protein [Rubripirellula reticaptiva]